MCGRLVVHSLLILFWFTSLQYRIPCRFHLSTYGVWLLQTKKYTQTRSTHENYNYIILEICWPCLTVVWTCFALVGFAENPIATRTSLFPSPEECKITPQIRSVHALSGKRYLFRQRNKAFRLLTKYHLVCVSVFFPWKITMEIFRPAANAFGTFKLSTIYKIVSQWCIFEFSTNGIENVGALLA